MLTNEEHAKNIHSLQNELASIVVPLLPLSARLKFLELSVRLFTEQRGVTLNHAVSSIHSTSQLRLVANQRDACQRFVEDLLKTGIERDPEFFKPYCASFAR